MAVVCLFFPEHALGQNATIIYNGYGKNSSALAAQLGNPIYWQNLPVGRIVKERLLLTDYLSEDGFEARRRRIVSVALHEPSPECKTWVCQLNDERWLKEDEFNDLRGQRICSFEIHGVMMTAHSYLPGRSSVYMEV